ncbi:hypothetical protein BO99DRAFT_50248 [Aspergillus violaceofuscus CBS 115571]|uniref:Uncharacterized protein n=1 Tax=Aspergillus violaceofuscus (strain CBS 115571) TaxID=1450538 RepID=A0A2V5HCC8_ASPV1|nr:hypothetical protein BO99DRAFT_50248 [Aspergillus violaceofuscus CBS 115571]
MMQSASSRSAGLQEFQCEDAWEMGRRLRDDMPGLHSIMVLELEVDGVANLVAKTTFGKEYFELIHQLDPFDESRAYEHILLNCPSSRLSYFPTYHGVILDLTREKYPLTGWNVLPRCMISESFTVTSVTSIFVSPMISMIPFFMISLTRT